MSVIAWIGAGKMGLPVCKRLQAAGHDVRILARRPEQAEKFSAIGFKVETSVPNLVCDAEIIFTCVSDDDALSDVLLNANTLQAIPRNSTLIDISTVSPDVSAKVSAGLPESINFLRSPVSGSTMMAEAGTLTALVSGPKEAFEKTGNIYAAFTKKVFHLGEGEEARFLKLAINSMVAATSALLGEALAFGKKGGMSPAAMLDVIAHSAVASPLIGYKKDMIIAGDYKPAATLSMLMKDVNLLLAAARAHNTAMPLNEMIHGIYVQAAEKGLGEKDFFVLVQEAEKAANA